jgi:hypothetical protein
MKFNASTKIIKFDAFQFMGVGFGTVLFYHLEQKLTLVQRNALPLISSNSTCSICCRFAVQVVRLVVKLWICCGFDV